MKTKTKSEAATGALYCYSDRPALSAQVRGSYGHPRNHLDERPEWPAPGRGVARGLLVEVQVREARILYGVDLPHARGPGRHLCVSHGLFARRRTPGEDCEYDWAGGDDVVYPHLVYATRWSPRYEGADPDVPWGWPIDGEALEVPQGWWDRGAPKRDR